MDLAVLYQPKGYPSLAAISLGQAVCAKLVQNMINDSCHHLFSELQHAEFKEAFNEFDKVRIYIPPETEKFWSGMGTPLG